MTTFSTSPRPAAVATRILLAAALLFAVIAVVPGGPSAEAASVVHRGEAFDTCRLPTNEQMDTWARSSPFTAVGVYIGGKNHSCDDQDISRERVATIASQGWNILPIWVGRQPACALREFGWEIDAARAYEQGVEEADAAHAWADRYGIPSPAPIYVDVEAYHAGNAACAGAVNQYLTGWTMRIKGHGRVSGVYGPAGSVMTNLAKAVKTNGWIVKPDAVWYAQWPSQPDGMSDGDYDRLCRERAMNLESRYFDVSLWPQRVHQYCRGHVMTYGGVSINIDNNIMNAPAYSAEGGPPPKRRLSASPMAIGRNPQGLLELYAVNADDEIFHRKQVSPGGDWGPWARVPGRLETVAMEANSDGRLEVWGINENDQIYHRRQYADGRWAQRWIPVEGSLETLAIARRGDGRLEVVGAQDDGSLFFKHQNADMSWSPGWFPMTDGKFQSVALERRSDDRLEAFATDPAGKVFHKRQYPDGTWSKGWHRVEGELDTVAMGRSGDGRLRVWGTQADDDVYEKFQEADGSWSQGWLPVGGKLEALTMEVNTDGRVEVWGVNFFGDVFIKRQNADGTWGVWFPSARPQ